MANTPHQFRRQSSRWNRHVIIVLPRRRTLALIPITRHSTNCRQDSAECTKSLETITLSTLLLQSKFTLLAKFINFSFRMMKFSLLSALLLAVFVLGLANAFVSHSNINVLRTSSSLHMTILTANGQKIECKEGSPLSSACAKLGVKPKYSCKRCVY